MKHVKISIEIQSMTCMDVIFLFFLICFLLFCLNPGRFLLSSSEHRGHSSVAQVFSEWINPKEMVCFSLWYHMDNRSEKRGGKQNCTTWESEGGGCSCLSCLVSSLTSSGSVNKCHLGLNHLLFCARMICVKVQTLETDYQQFG